MKKEIDKTLYSVLFYSVDVLVGAQYVDTHNTRTCGAFCAHAKSPENSVSRALLDRALHRVAHGDLARCCSRSSALESRVSVVPQQ